VISGWVGLKKARMDVARHRGLLHLSLPELAKTPMARYMVPILPIILYGIFQGVQILFRTIRQTLVGQTCGDGC